MLITLIVVLAFFCVVWWAIGYAAPPDLVKPLRILEIVVLLIWLITRLLPAMGISL